MHDGIEQLIDSLTPGIAGRMATDASAFDDVIAVHDMAVAVTEQLLLETVTAARSAGRTWTQIGEVLGISRQEAQQRFTGVGAVGNGFSADDELAPNMGIVAATNSTDVASAINTERRIVRGLPFSGAKSVAALNEAGKYGWHSVKAITNEWGTHAIHEVTKDNQQWEHLSTGIFKKMPAGWIRVDSPRWWGVSYWTRPLGTPALPGNVDPQTFWLA